MKVVLVEDNTLVRQTIVDVLQMLDHEVYHTASAEEALALLQRLDKPPDMLISDVSLPGLDGIGMLQTIKRQFPHCQALLTSGLPREQHDIYGAQFLQKPFSLDQLMAQIALAEASLRQKLAG